MLPQYEILPRIPRQARVRVTIGCAPKRCSGLGVVAASSIVLFVVAPWLATGEIEAGVIYNFSIEEIVSSSVLPNGLDEFILTISGDITDDADLTNVRTSNVSATTSSLGSNYTYSNIDVQLTRLDISGLIEFPTPSTGVSEFLLLRNDTVYTAASRFTSRLDGTAGIISQSFAHAFDNLTIDSVKYRTFEGPLLTLSLPAPDGSTTATPEPSTLLLFGSGLTMAVGARIRRKWRGGLGGRENVSRTTATAGRRT